MRVTIEDLEALKELSEELEENHIETERSMQDEISTCHFTIGWTWLISSCGIDEKDVQLAERQQRIEQLEEACQDTERTISRFRELVVQLERSVTSRFRYDGLNKVNGCSELETLRSESQNAQNDSAMAASQTAAVMSLNLKLQSAATRNQARNIDHELKRIEANEAKEMLNIVQVMSMSIRVQALLTTNRVSQPYLPQIYVETDADATRCYLFFQRMAAKTDLINIVTAQAHNLPESLNGSVSETLVGVCEVGSNLTMPIGIWSLINAIR